MKRITQGKLQVFALLFESIGVSITAAGSCAKFLIFVVGILNYLLDIFQGHINYKFK